MNPLSIILLYPVKKLFIWIRREICTDQAMFKIKNQYVSGFRCERTTGDGLFHWRNHCSFIFSGLLFDDQMSNYLNTYKCFFLQSISITLTWNISLILCLEQCGFFKRTVYYRIMPKYHGVKVRKEERYNLAFQPEHELSRKFWVTNWTEMHEYYYWPLHLSPSRARGAWWLEDVFY